MIDAAGEGGGAPAVIEACGLRKVFRGAVALDRVDLRVEQGRILGLFGPNGAGKSTLLHAILGLVPHEGALTVLGRDPWRERHRLMRDVAFAPDVAVLPRWIRVAQVLDHVAAVHPRFERGRAETFLTRTEIRLASRVAELSQGMVAQLQLALVMAIDAKLLVLDEPTLGLDLVVRKQFYDLLLTDGFERGRTVLLATHEVEEIQHVPTDILFMNRGRVVLSCRMDELESRYLEVSVRPDDLRRARGLGPIHERRGFGRHRFLFDGVDRGALEAIGPVRTPGLADLFLVAMDPQVDRAARGSPG